MNQLQCRDSSLVGFVVLLLSFSFHTPHGYHWQVLVGVCRPVLQILTLFRNKKCHFPHQFSDLAPVVLTLDSAIHRINHYPADKYYEKKWCYLLDSDLSKG